MSSFEIFVNKKFNNEEIKDFVSTIYSIGLSEVFIEVGDYSAGWLPREVFIYCVVNVSYGDFLQRIEIFERSSSNFLNKIEFLK